LAYNVVCRITGEKGKSNEFIKIGRYYYKSQEIYDKHQNELKCRDEIFDIIHDILGYKKDQLLPKSVKDKINKTIGIIISQYKFYEYSIILTTFKLYKNQIIYYMSLKEFDNENQKISYIFAVIQNNINDVYKRIENAKIAKEKTKNVNLNKFSNNSAKYKTKTKQIKNERLKKIWK